MCVCVCVCGGGGGLLIEQEHEICWPAQTYHAVAHVYHWMCSIGFKETLCVYNYFAQRISTVQLSKDGCLQKPMLTAWQIMPF